MIWGDIFNYKNGFIYWKSGRKAGSNPKGNNYSKVRVSGIYYQVHRVIYEMHNGKIQDGMQIDHINQVKADNRIENLRLVTESTNKQNRPMQKKLLKWRYGGFIRQIEKQMVCKNTEERKED